VSSQEGRARGARGGGRASRGSRDSARDELFAAGAISRQEMEQADTALRTAEANLRALERPGAAASRCQLRYFTVTAPTAGIVGRRARCASAIRCRPRPCSRPIDQNETLEVYVPVPV
jgi:multidrug efflux pump subunit AcrA (membrane-fusion protein)